MSLGWEAYLANTILDAHRDDQSSGTDSWPPRSVSRAMPCMSALCGGYVAITAGGVCSVKPRTPRTPN